MSFDVYAYTNPLEKNPKNAHFFCCIADFWALLCKVADVSPIHFRKPSATTDGTYTSGYKYCLFPGFGGFDSGPNLQPYGTNGTRPIFRVVKLFVALASPKSAIQHDSFLGLSRWGLERRLGLKTGRLGRCFFVKTHRKLTFWTP